mmetsp:Transcript_46740/g.98173  ORF Transcript_46740/g.98173 Transcript_46740/m.98173 type:complete len:112 (-) Transcript_46740:216-551(-)
MILLGRGSLLFLLEQGRGESGGRSNKLSSLLDALLLDGLLDAPLLGDSEMTARGVGDGEYFEIEMTMTMATAGAAGAGRFLVERVACRRTNANQLMLLRMILIAVNIYDMI